MLQTVTTVEGSGVTDTDDEDLYEGSADGGSGGDSGSGTEDTAGTIKDFLITREDQLKVFIV